MQHSVLIAFLYGVLCLTIPISEIGAAEPLPSGEVPKARARQLSLKNYKKQLKKWGEARISSRALTSKALKKLTPEAFREILDSMLVTRSSSKKGDLFYSGYVYKSSLILTYLARRPLHKDIPEYCDIIYLKCSSEEENRDIMYEYQLIRVDDGDREHIGNFRLYRFPTKKLNKKHSRAQSTFMSITALEEQGRFCKRPPSIYPLHSLSHLEYHLQGSSQEEAPRLFQSAPSTPRSRFQESTPEPYKLEIPSQYHEPLSLSYTENFEGEHTRERSGTFSTYAEIKGILKQMEVDEASLDSEKGQKKAPPRKPSRFPLLSTNSLSHITTRLRKSKNTSSYDQSHSPRERRERFIRQRS